MKKVINKEIKINKEIANLLDILKNDNEIGTHGATSEFLVLANSINEGKDAHNLFKGYSMKKEDYKKAIMKMPKYFDVMSEEAFQRLLSFASVLELVTDREVGLAIKNSCTLQAYYDEQVGKRAMFMQYFSKCKPPLYTSEELAKETKVKEKNPWQWIDAALDVNPALAKEEIINQVIKSKDDQRYFYTRISFLLKRQADNYLDGIVESVEGKIPKDTMDRIKKSISFYRSDVFKNRKENE
jgi:hypothetical protein